MVLYRNVTFGAAILTCSTITVDTYTATIVPSHHDLITFYTKSDFRINLNPVLTNGPEKCILRAQALIADPPKVKPW
jgi:hypothetical protein